MNILLSGYVLGEGRMSMVRFGRTLREHLNRVADPADRILLDERSADLPDAPLRRQGLGVKLEKRVGVPLRLRLKSYGVLHIVDSDYAAAIPREKLAHTVVTCHDMMPFLQREHGLPEPFGRVGRHFFEQNLARMAACGRVVADSHFTRDCVLKYTACDPGRVDVIPLGVDHACFRPMPPEAIAEFRKRNGFEGKEVVLHVGAGAWYKNVETVLEVLSTLVRQGRSKVLLLKVGRITAEQTELAERLNLRDRIVSLERISDADMPLVYASAQVLLFPSLCEGFGLPPLEAMACGTPVVCSTGGSLGEVAGDAAAVHESGDVQALAASCTRILECASYAAEMRVAGLKRAEAFRWESVAAAYYRLYNELLT